MVETIAALGKIVGAFREVIPLIKEPPFLGPSGAFISKRRAALVGHWTGKLETPNHPRGITTGDITFDLAVRGKHVTGKGTGNMQIPSAHGSEPRLAMYEVTARGALLTESYLRLEYENSDPQALQFGTILFHLDGTGMTLDGQYIGYGHYAQGIVTGHCRITKLGK
jgi:hypothetical protein